MFKITIKIVQRVCQKYSIRNITIIYEYQEDVVRENAKLTVGCQRE